VSAPTARAGHAAVWTGSRMLIWGGNDGIAYLNDGSLYDPTTGSWSAISSASAPSPRAYPSPVWTGSEMLLWGGYDDSQYFDTGGRYAPASDTWSPMTTLGAPEARGFHTSVWTGQRMIVWGGHGSSAPLYSGGRYSPASDTWEGTTLHGSPLARFHHQAIWSGDQMIVWGGQDNLTTTYFDTGGLYCTCASSSAFYRDDDGDGYGNDASSLTACHAPPGYVAMAGDCNDSRNDLWNPPGEVVNVHLNSVINVAWSPPISPGGNVVRYDLIRSGSAADFVSSAVCVLTNGSATMQNDFVLPALNSVLFYLVRARNDCPQGLGLLGTASNGVPRTARTCP